MGYQLKTLKNYTNQAISDTVKCLITIIFTHAN